MFDEVFPQFAEINDRVFRGQFGLQIELRLREFKLLDTRCAADRSFDFGETGGDRLWRPFASTLRPMSIQSVQIRRYMTELFATGGERLLV